MRHQGFHGPVCLRLFVTASDFSSPVHFSGAWVWLYFSQTSDQTRTQCQKLTHSQSEVCGRCSGFLSFFFSFFFDIEPSEFLQQKKLLLGLFVYQCLSWASTQWYAIPALLCLFLVQETFSHAASSLFSPLHISVYERVIIARNKLHYQGALRDTYIPVLTCLFFSVGSWTPCLCDTVKAKRGDGSQGCTHANIVRYPVWQHFKHCFA